MTFWYIFLHIILPIVGCAIGIAIIVFFFRGLYAISNEINTLKNEVRSLRKIIEKQNKKKDEI